MKVTYLDKHGLGTLVKQIKKSLSGAYKVKGRAIYADQAFVSSNDKDKVAAGASSIDEVGLWQRVNRTWTKVTETTEGAVYNIINSFTTDDNFVEGSGHLVDAGTNIVAVDIRGTTKFDILSGTLDLDKYQTKKLSEPIKVDSDVGSTVTDESGLPEENVVDGSVAVTESGDVYVASVSDGRVKWTKVGNTTTVEGALQFLSAFSPTRPITDEEIEEIWNETE